MNIKFFQDIKQNDIVGGKGASLAKMWQNKFNIPNGYVIKAELFTEFLVQNNIKHKVEELINNCDINDEKGIEENSKKILEIISKCNISSSIENQIIKNYEKLNSKYVAVRSSATSEDGKNHAWAGQLETFLNVDKTNIIECVKKCWYSIFSPRALFYRIKNNDMSDISVAVIIQKMIQSDISGIAFSVNPTSNNKNEIIIESILGLGEAIVSGKVTPDTYIVNKKENKIENKEIKIQKIKLIKGITDNEWVLAKHGEKQKLDNDKILELATIIKKIENFYNYPIDVEWGMENGEIYILQCRPITTFKKDEINEIISNIKNTGEWKYYVTRNFNWFLENTQIDGSGKKAQNDLLGFNVATKNYLILNGDEYSLEKDFEDTYRTFDENLENDIDFFDKFAKKEFDLVDEIKQYMDNLKYKDLSSMNFKELYDETKKFNYEYVRSFVPAFTRPESFLEIALKRELENMKLDNNEIENIFIKVSTCPNLRKIII